MNSVRDSPDVLDVLRGAPGERWHDDGGDAHGVAEAAVGPLQRDQAPQHGGLVHGQDERTVLQDLDIRIGR